MQQQLLPELLPCLSKTLARGPPCNLFLALQLSSSPWTSAFSVPLLARAFFAFLQLLIHRVQYLFNVCLLCAPVTLSRTSGRHIRACKQAGAWKQSQAEAWLLVAGLSREA